MISIDDFKKIEIKIGEILSAEKVADTDKLLRLKVDLGEDEPRQIVSGIAEYFDSVEELVGLKCPFVANLEPRTIRGVDSNGMIMAIIDNDGNFSLLSPNEKIAPGTRVS